MARKSKGFHELEDVSMTMSCFTKRHTIDRLPTLPASREPKDYRLKVCMTFLTSFKLLSNYTAPRIAFTVAAMVVGGTT